MLRPVIIISLLALVSPLGTSAVRVGLQQTPAGPATIDVPGVRQWFLDMVKAAQDNFQSVSGEEIRVENRAQGRVAHYHVLLKIPPGFKQTVHKTTEGTFAEGTVTIVKLPNDSGEFQMAGYTFTAADLDQANAYFITLSKMVKSCLDTKWTVDKDDDADLSASNDDADLEVDVEHLFAKEIHLTIIHTPV
jgi:hypothetical protein